MGSSSTAELSLIIKAKNLATGPIDKLHGSLTRAGGAVKGLGGAFMTLGKVGILGVVTAIGAAIGFMGVATKAAAEEQVGIERLNTALKANVRGFKGNTDAIEAVIAQREKLAFSDDELRGSLSTLVTKTHDLNLAQQAQAVAMDVARAKGISLEEATALVSKGMDGSAKALKLFGLTADESSTPLSNLEAIQKRVAGQAEAYSKTAVGGQQAFKIAMDDVVEDIGSALLPMVTKVFTWLTQYGIPAIRGIVAQVSKWIAENRPLIEQIGTFLSGALKVVVGRVTDVVTWIGKFVAMITSNKDVMNVLRAALAAIAEAAGLIWSALATVAKWLGEVFHTITTNKTVITVFGRAWDLLGKGIGIVVDGLSWILKNIGKVINALSHLKLPDITGITNLIPHFATGGTVAGARGEATLAVVHGGERITAPGSTSPGAVGASGFTIVGVSERQLIDMVDRGLYFKLRRASPVPGRV